MAGSLTTVGAARIRGRLSPGRDLLDSGVGVGNPNMDAIGLPQGG